jgi:cation diffusion facilitator family transporter
MRDFLIKHFVKDYRNTKDPKVRESYGKFAGVIGMISNLILCSFKIALGIMFDSIAILADGINNLSDASASLITLIGFRLAGKEPDKDHPYGHGRFEYLTGLMISAMILVIGVQLLRASIEKTLHPTPIEFNYLTIVVLSIAIVVKIWQSCFNVSIGKIIDSSTLKATGADSRNDVLATSAVLLSVIACHYSGYHLDGPVGIFVALFIIYSGWGLIRETIAPLLGQAPDPAELEALQIKIESYQGVLGIHDLIVHDYGPGRIFASVHVEVDAAVDIMHSHDMVDNIEREVYKYMGVLLTVHMDPVDTKDPLTAKVKEQLSEITKDMEYIINIHDLRVVSGKTHHNVIFDVIMERGCNLTEAQLKAQLTEKLQEYDPLYYTVITVDRSFA